MNRRLCTAACMLLLAINIGAGYGADTGSADKRFQMIYNLIETSSVARQIESGGDSQLLEQRRRARALYQQALDEQSRGNNTAATELLDQAANMMFEAGRKGRPEGQHIAKQERDFQARRQSVDAMLETHRRIGQEKGLSDKTGPIEEQVRELERSAVASFEADEIDSALATINRAYQLVVVSIQSMRGGETMVKTLEFASVEDEYHYELDRNDTHKMLANMLIDKLDAGSGKLGMISKFMDRAAELRVEAEAMAAAGKYPDAITSLEGSTRELVRAIRSAGLYIPG